MLLREGSGWREIWDVLYEIIIYFQLKTEEENSIARCGISPLNRWTGRSQQLLQTLQANAIACCFQNLMVTPYDSFDIKYKASDSIQIGIFLFYLS